MCCASTLLGKLSLLLHSFIGDMSNHENIFGQDLRVLKKSDLDDDDTYDKDR